MAFVFGIHAVDGLLRSDPSSVEFLYLQRDRDDKRLRALLTLAENQGVPIVREDREQLSRRVSGRHQGAVAQLKTDAAGAPQWDEAQLMAHVAEATSPVLLLVLDGVTDPHNLGACLRSADAAGVDAVIAPRDKSASITSTVRKVACGAAETVPFVQVTNLARALQGLKDLGVWLYGTTGNAEKTIYDSDLRGAVAMIMGAEGQGMRRLTGEKCDFLVSLPMAGDVSSLNVSVATGVCLFEAVRQRRGIAP